MFFFSHSKSSILIDPQTNFATLTTPQGADVNKTTIAGAHPDAAVDFAVRYLGAKVAAHANNMIDGSFPFCSAVS